MSIKTRFRIKSMIHLYYPKDINIDMKLINKIKKWLEVDENEPIGLQGIDHNKAYMDSR
jgi:hypothetical protein